MSHSPLLGQLIQIDLRNVWENEANNFTPWLAQEQNIGLLGNAIGLDLEVEAQEKEVGPFRADILCKDTITNNWVLIENQLARTDHTHLGQLLTYAAGLQAVTIVWIASRFTEEHRAALDWLNEITDERFQFFGLEIELWKIGDSPPAPKFNLVSKPNDWSKRISRAASSIEAQNMSGTKLIQLAYWTAFKQYLEDQGSILKPRTAKADFSLGMPIGRSGFRLEAIASVQNAGEIRAELIMNKEGADKHFQFFQERKTEIEEKLGKLEWYRDAEVRRRIYCYKQANILNQEDWVNQHSWLKEKLENLYKIFYPLIQALPK